MSPEHIIKDCPEFRCFKCEERGHFARECSAERCLDCQKTVNKCECRIEQDETHVSRQEHGRDNAITQNGKEIEETKDDEEPEKNESQNREQDTRNERMEDGTESQNGDNGKIENEMNTKGEQGGKTQKEQQKEGDNQSMQEDQAEELWTQEDTSGSSIGERNGQEQQNNGDEEKRVNKRRRQLKVTPCLDNARKRGINKEMLKNRYDLLREVEDMN